MDIHSTEIPDVKLIRPEVFRDARGFFVETWNHRDYSAAGLGSPFVQDNHSRSRRGTLRGLHYQIRQPQGKLVRVARGAVFDVSVDLRRSSPTFGRWVGVELSDVRHEALWIPPGFAHGFLTLSAHADLLYRCTNFYSPAHERAIRWNDAELGIDWPLEGSEPLLSARDAAAEPFADADTFP